MWKYRVTSNLRHTVLLKRDFHGVGGGSFIAGKCISLSVKFITLLAKPFAFGSSRTINNNIIIIIIIFINCN